ncbi:MAG: AbrB/MazE/SpoVT family DNA-binding domain-containing protein [Candidatus Dormibacteraceae bacterium]
MNYRVGAKGQVVIPKDIRVQAGLYPGVEVSFVLEGERVVLSPQIEHPSLGGQFKQSGMAARLLLDRAKEPK